MPYYDFLNENSGEIKSLFFHMNEDKKYTDESGYEWVRQYSSPQTSIDTKWNPDNSKDFVEKSKKYKNGTVGDLWEKSSELSQKREKLQGIDPVKQQYYENYKKTHDKKDHPDIKKQKLKDKLSKKSSMFEWSD